MALIHKLSWLSSVAVAMAAGASAVGAIELDVNNIKVQAGLKVAQGAPAARAAFHRAYLFGAADSSIERIEVVTEYRRVVLIAEEKLFRGDQMGAQNVQQTQNALQEWRRKVSIVVRLRFPLQNVLVRAPQAEIVLAGADGDVSRLDMRNETQYALQSGPPNQQQPQTVIGLIAEAVFDAARVGQSTRTASVRLDGKEVARVPMDFSRLE